MSGGRPKGKSLRTLEKEREVAEQRDPTLRTAASLAISQCKTCIARCFAPPTVPAQEPVCAPPATVPATVPAEEPVCADEEPVEPLAHTLPLANTLPKMPTKLADRLKLSCTNTKGAQCGGILQSDQLCVLVRMIAVAWAMSSWGSAEATSFGINGRRNLSQANARAKRATG